MQLEWGSKILEAAEQLNAQENLILMIRHSERPSFENIPFEQWLSVELTARGVQVAKNFGRAISSKTNTLRVHHWGSKRCFMTADAISAGAREGGSRVRGPDPIDLNHPILNMEEYNRELRGSHWEAFLDRWLNSPESMPSMKPPDIYAKEIFRSVLHEKRSSPRGATIIATHDLYLMPLVNYAFHPAKPWIDFLDGVAIKSRDGEFTISYDGHVEHLSLNELDHPI